LFSSANQVENKTVFNIGGNKCRLIAAIHYNGARVYLRLYSFIVITTKEPGRTDNSRPNR
jgi:mRNA-degrading endonuclease HigB of HigAB toxin-antitoxin module